MRVRIIRIKLFGGVEDEIFVLFCLKFLSPYVIYFFLITFQCSFFFGASQLAYVQSFFFCSTKSKSSLCEMHKKRCVSEQDKDAGMNGGVLTAHLSR